MSMHSTAPATFQAAFERCQGTSVSFQALETASCTQGLGKTVQVIAMMCHLVEVQKTQAPFLIIAPASVLPNWKAELERWAPCLKVLVYRGSARDRAEAFDDSLGSRGKPAFHVLLTTYEMLMGKHDRPRLSRMKWQVIVVDEGHRLKNSECKLTMELSSYRTTCKILLTGTPLQNHLSELWALMNFLMPDLFTSSDDFSHWFGSMSKSKGADAHHPTEEEVSTLNAEEYLLVTSRLHLILRPFMLRRLKSAVATELPSKIERVLTCEMSPYQSALAAMVSKESPDKDSRADMKSINNMVMVRSITSPA
eukprot:363132-Chlamydomonas_euryale.AAC.18